MRMFKKVLAGFVAAAMVATMAGCGSKKPKKKGKGKKPKKYCSTCSKVVKNEQNRLYYKRKSEKLKNEIKP